MDITKIIQAVIALVGALVSAFVIPWLRRRTSAHDLEEMLAWVKIAVAAAEQLYTNADGDAKKQYVLKYLAEKGYEVDTDDMLNALEAEVLRLHNELYGAAKA